MQDVLRIREQHGNNFAIRLPCGQFIPWRALSVSEYLEYKNLLQAEAYPPAFIQDEIFKKCVLDTTLVKNIGKLKAGTVSIVAEAIMVHSGPQNIDDFNQLLNIARHLADQIVPTLTTMVCTAFPAYTPDSLQELDFVTFMTRVAQAESKLLGAGIIAQPLSFSSSDEQPQEVPEKKAPPVPPKPEDLAGIWNDQQRPTPPPAPIATPTEKQTIITAGDIKDHQLAYTGHENVDKIVNEDEMLNTTISHYKDYLDQMAQGKTVQIKTVEERLADAKIRAEKSKLELREMIEQRKEILDSQKTEIQKLDELVQKRKAKREARRKKR